MNILPSKLSNESGFLIVDKATENRVPHHFLGVMPGNTTDCSWPEEVQRAMKVAHAQKEIRRLVGKLIR